MSCSVDGCDRQPQSRTAGLCSMHLSRQRSTGSTGGAEPIRVHGRTECCVDGCPKPHRAKGYCYPHYMNLKRTGDPIPRGRGWRRGELSPHWRADLTYHGVHSRLRTQRGPAKSHTCPCGAPAVDWSYNHMDPDEKSELVGGYLLPYSTDLSFYEALCRECHRQRDLTSENLIGVVL